MHIVKGTPGSPIPTELSSLKFDFVFGEVDMASNHAIITSLCLSVQRFLWLQLKLGLFSKNIFTKKIIFFVSLLQSHFSNS